MSSYIEWIMNIIHCPEQYTELIEHLDGRPFTWIIPNDSNRASDGLTLRSRWVERYGDEYDMMRPCSVLEMMVALACRIEDDIMFDPDYGDRSFEWFWIMIKNLGLSSFVNDRFDEKKFNRIIDIFLERRYSMNGHGGMFPLKIPKINQKLVEIWYQMSEYLVENFE